MRKRFGPRGKQPDTSGTAKRYPSRLRIDRQCLAERSRRSTSSAARKAAFLVLSSVDPAWRRRLRSGCDPIVAVSRAGCSEERGALRCGIAVGLDDAQAYPVAGDNDRVWARGLTLPGAQMTAANDSLCVGMRCGRSMIGCSVCGGVWRGPRDTARTRPRGVLAATSGGDGCECRRGARGEHQEHHDKCPEAMPAGRHYSFSLSASE